MAKPRPLPKLGAHAGVWTNAVEVISTRLRDLLDLSPCLQDASRVEQLHDMRIAARRLRYSLEMFVDVVPTHLECIVTGALSACKELQELLGAIHDADVLMPQLVEQLHRESEPALGNDQNAAPFGVHFINWDACTGLISTCKDIMLERDNAFESASEMWRQHAESGVFAALTEAVGDGKSA